MSDARSNLRQGKSQWARWSAVLTMGLALSHSVTTINAQDHPNVLFLSLDDFGPYLKGYGHEQIIAPNMDRLMEEGLTFNRAYCQMAICNSSRASLMTGLRPDTIGVYDLRSHFREKVPDAVTLPEHFKNHGYHTQAVGKNFHPAFALHADVAGQPNLDDPQSWSKPLWLPGPPRYYHTPEGIADAKRVFVARHMKVGETEEDWENYVVRGFAVEAPEVSADDLYDGQVTNRALAVMQELAAAQQVAPAGEAQPFFLGVGFLKPHMPFIAPKKYWDLYDRATITLAENNFPPRDAPAIASQVHWNEARAQSDVPNTGPILPAQSRELKHGYFACISYVDALIGRLIAELEHLELRDNTIIVLWSDHGFALGENSIWGKLTNFETSTRTPLIVVRPDGKGAGLKTDALVELVDIYPSVTELAGLPQPRGLEGESFVPLFTQPDRPWKTAVFSQYYRPHIPNYRVHPLAIKTPAGYQDYPSFATMGYSMKTDRYRFAWWRPVDQLDEVWALELYDHANDPAENVNLANHPDYQDTVEMLTKKMQAGWQAARPNL